MAISLTHVRRFLAVAQAGKISGAARALNITQSAVTLSLKEFERDLGLKLLERRPHGVDLTPEGRRLVGYARQVINSVDDMLAAATSTQNNLGGTLSIGTTFTGSGWLLVPGLVSFRRKYPNVEVTIIEGSRKKIQRDTEKGDLDLSIIITSNIIEHSRLCVQPLVRSPRRLWISPVHPLAKNDVVRLEEIAPFPYALLTMDETDRATLDYWSRYGLVPNVTFKTSAVEGVREWVATGQGVTILADAVFRNWSHDGRKVVRRDIVETLPPMEVGVIHSNKRPPSKLAELFVCSLSEQISEAASGGASKTTSL